MASHPRPERRAALEERFGVRTTESNAAAVEGADTIVLAIKPQMLRRVGTELAAVLRPEQLLISVLAGADDDGPPQRPSPRRHRARHAQHARAAGQGHDRLVRHAGGERAAARAQRGPARRAGQGAAGGGREVRLDGHGRERHRPGLRVPGHGGPHRRGRAPGLPAPHRPRHRHRDPARRDALRAGQRRPPRSAAQHGHVARQGPRPRPSTSSRRADSARSSRKLSGRPIGAPRSSATSSRSRRPRSPERP